MSDYYKKKLQKLLPNETDDTTLEIYYGTYNDTHFNKSINIVFFEKLLLFFKNKIKEDHIQQRNYSIYHDNNKQLLIFDNGSSIANKINIESKVIKKDSLHFLCHKIEKRKISNDSFEPKYNYDKIENIEAIQFTYKDIQIEFMKDKSNNVEYYIKIICKTLTHIDEVMSMINNNI